MPQPSLPQTSSWLLEVLTSSVAGSIDRGGKGNGCPSFFYEHGLRLAGGVWYRTESNRWASVHVKCAVLAGWNLAMCSDIWQGSLHIAILLARPVFTLLRVPVW
jgi:hypothetical protein